MQEVIRKVIFNELRPLPHNKALLWPDFAVAFEAATGYSVNECLEDAQSVFDDLEEKQYVRLEKLPNGMPRIIKGVHFDIWEREMNPKQDQEVSIGSVNAENVQIGNANTMNINVTPEEFVDALSRLVENPEKSRSIIEEMTSYLKQGLSIGELVKKFIGLFS